MTETQKCELCKEASYVVLRDKQPPADWMVVDLRDAGTQETKLLICPFCVAVAKALQAQDMITADEFRAPGLASEGIPASAVVDRVRPGEDWIDDAIGEAAAADDARITWQRIAHRFKPDQDQTCEKCGLRIDDPIHRRLIR